MTVDSILQEWLRPVWRLADRVISRCNDWGKQTSLELRLGHLLDKVGGVLEVVAISADGEHNADLLGRRKLMNSLDGGDEIRVGRHQDGPVIEVLDGVSNHAHGNVHIGSLFFVSSKFLLAKVAGDFLLSEFAEHDLDTGPSLRFDEGLMLPYIIRLPRRQGAEVDNLGQRIPRSEDRLRQGTVIEPQKLRV